MLSTPWYSLVLFQTLMVVVALLSFTIMSAMHTLCLSHFLGITAHLFAVHLRCPCFPKKKKAVFFYLKLETGDDSQQTGSTLSPVYTVTLKSGVGSMLQTKKHCKDANLYFSKVRAGLPKNTCTCLCLFSFHLESVTYWRIETL